MVNYYDKHSVTLYDIYHEYCEIEVLTKDKD